MKGIEPRRRSNSSPNQGSEDYIENSLGSSQFAVIGTAKNWRSNNTYWNYTLPFQFPFYGIDYTSVAVSTEGFLKFVGGIHAGDGDNTDSKLRQNAMIAPLWDNLRTNGVGDDIFIDTATAGQVTIRWDADQRVR